MGMLDDKRAIVMGAGSGVGRASSLRFAEEGARVVCADVNEEGAKETVRLIEGAGGTAIAVRTDVSKEADVVATIQACVDAFGRLDILFNNVGVPTPRLGAGLTDHTWEDFERLFDINVGGVFLGCKHAVLRFTEQGDGGVILNTGSVAGLVAWGGTVYGATKGAVHQLTKAVAIEGAPLGHPGERHLPGGHALHRLHRRRRARRRARPDRGDRQARRLDAPARSSDPGRGLRRSGRLPGVGPGGQHHRRPRTDRRRIRGPMSASAI